MRISNYPTDTLTGDELILATDVNTSTQEYKTAKLPERTELQYASVASLINAVETPKQFENALTYIERFDAKEFSVLFVKALTTKESKFKETSVFIDWHIKNQDILV